MLQALILYEEALDADTTQNQTAYSNYFSDSKDSAELEADIANFQSAKEAALWTMRVYSEPGNKASQAEKNATKAAYNHAAAGLRDAQEELRQLHEFNERSAQHFTETASLQGTVMSALSQISTQFSSFSAGSGFTDFVNKTPDWAKTVNSEWEKRTKVNDRLKAVNQKLKNGEPLTDKDIKAIRAYQDRYPSKELPSELKEALLQYDHHEQEVSNNFDIVVDKAEKSAQELSEQTGISYEDALNYLLTGKVGSRMKAIVNSSKVIGETLKNGRKEFLENKYVKASNIVVDKVGNVKVGNKMLYNKETGHVYDANGNRVKRGRLPHGQTESSKYKKAVMEGIDPDRTYVGKERGFNAEGLKTAGTSAKIAAKEATKFWDDFDWRKTNIEGVGKAGKALKGLGLISSAIEVTGNVKENFIDDKASSVSEKIRNFTADQGGDIVTGVASASAGAAIGAAAGTLIPIPGVGTVVGAAVGYGVGKLLDMKFSLGGSKKESISDRIKGGIKGLLGG
ncbi:hypothetical protein [Streptococcus pluranimalium]|uniref:LXG domain-containing protein n=1 Tax=Streptococcus pluranimalium TaxID=82348 RepID=A0A345VJL0_9STRE|nr:hypothetical protein [Streptococcus pluranimalium]AXJ12912.1 hypothetical protein Sp14A_09910 [Streptococcus pluranimalium]